MTRKDRITAFCDWLDTIPPDPTFFRHPEFAQFAELTDGEIEAAKIEMPRRASSNLAEADALEAEGRLGNARRVNVVVANEDDPKPAGGAA